MGIFDMFGKKAIDKEPNISNIMMCYTNYFNKSTECIYSTDSTKTRVKFIGESILDYTEFDIENLNTLLSGCKINTSRDKLMYLALERATLYVIQTDMFFKKHFNNSAKSDFFINIAVDSLASAFIGATADESKDIITQEIIAPLICKMTTFYGGLKRTNIEDKCCRRCINACGLESHYEIVAKQLRPILAISSSLFDTIVLPRVTNKDIFNINPSSL